MAYSWDDDNDMDSGDGGGAYSFHDARKSYDDLSVINKSSTKKSVYNFRNPFLKTDSEYPIIIGIDTTGSMAEWPKIFFDKLPLLYKEAIKYFPGCSISFQAINDFLADGEDVALQPAPFGKGAELDELIANLYPYGGGGGNGGESYEIFAAYNSFLEAPNAKIKPIAIILGDEPLFKFVPEEVADFYKLSEGAKKVSTKKVFDDLRNVCDVFLVRKPYYGFGMDEPVMKNWEEFGGFDRERILNIQDPKRVVDVILGIFGVLTNKIDTFEEELTSRQNKNQVSEVLNSLKLLKTNYSVNMNPLGQKSKTVDIGQKSQKTKGLQID
ncbi:MAG: hypothetical protein KA885_13360 [Spirochaetes bacterium]|nr:hypothetical protein [Spirochaetota bacterium]